MNDTRVKHRAIIDTYFINGFQGYKAVQEYNSNLSRASANKLFHDIMHNDNNVEYIEKKKKKLQLRTDIKNENILRELINWLYMDATDLIGLDKDEIKQLPSDIKRCIQSFKVINKTYVDRAGQEHKDETIEIKLIDKVKTVEIINRHIGFYEVDNRQKQSKINLTKIDNITLNNLFNAMTNNDALN